MTDTELNGFLRLLTHDLQNQLGAIDLNLQILPTLVPDNDSTSVTMAPFLKRAALAAADLNETLVDIQMFTRALNELTDGKSLSMAMLNLSNEVRDCGRSLAGVAKERQVDFKVNITENIQGLGDSENIQRALKILVNDALRYSFPNSRVTVSCSSSPSPMIEITSTQEGLFDSTRPTLARFLAERLLISSGVQLISPPASQISTLRMVWKAGQM